MLEQVTLVELELKHYSGAMFYYGQEWYWGVDRLHYLEQRLSELGVDRDPSAAKLYATT